MGKEINIETFSDEYEKVIDNMVGQAIQTHLPEFKLGKQQIFTLFKKKKEDQPVYLMYLDIHKKDELNIHCDITSITQYDNLEQYQEANQLC